MLGMEACVILVAVYIYIYIDIFTKNKNTLSKNKDSFVCTISRIINKYKDMIYLCNFNSSKII